MTIISEDELRARISLWRTSGIGAASLQKILQHLGSAQAALNASTETIAAIGGIRRDAIEAMQQCQLNDSDADIAWLQGSEQRHILTPEHDIFPRQLLDTASCPPLLFAVGNPQLLSDPQIAMVGSRNASQQGQENAHAFALHLANNGLAITSGMALGIDTASHQGALKAQGGTIAVVATGLDIIYPSRNKKLATQIVEQGGVIVSEFPIGTKPQQQHFPRRNRIISGLSVGTLVVEATLRSGSLVTAKHAMEQGREVFAIPGSIHNPMARGCHQLIRQGAKLVETANDILEELAPQLSHYLNTTNPSPNNETVSTPPNDIVETTLDPEEHQVLQGLGYEPLPIDQIILNTGLTADIVSSILLMLELKGYVMACGGGHYMRTALRE